MKRLEGHEYAEACGNAHELYPCKYGHVVCALEPGGLCSDEEWQTDEGYCSQCHEVPLNGNNLGGVCGECAMSAAEALEDR